MTEDPFDILGLEPHFLLEQQALERRVRELSRALHPDRHAGASAGQRRLALGRAISVNEAHRVLKDPVRRAEVLRTRVANGHVDETKAEPAFLMEMMELREQLAEARLEGDRAQVRALGEQVNQRQDEVLGRLDESFRRALDGAPPDLAALDADIAQLRYLRRFLDEVRAIEDEG